MICDKFCGTANDIGWIIRAGGENKYPLCCIDQYVEEIKCFLMPAKERMRAWGSV